MSNEERKKTIAELEALKADALNANPNLSERDLNAAIANGVTDSKRLAGIKPYHQIASSAINYGIEGVPFHDTDGVVETTRKGR